jgi:hypothetical protein
MNHVDALIICAEALPLPQAMNLLSWWLQGPTNEDARDINHPSFQWWVEKHAHEATQLARHKGWYEALR